MSGTVANERLAALAAESGVDADGDELRLRARRCGRGRAGRRADAGSDGVRTVTGADLPSIDPLHEAEFPATYFSAAQLVERAASGEQVVLVAEGVDGAFAGYIAGRVQPDGEGYIDFVAVDPAGRGTGVGRRLITGLVRRVLPATTTGRVSLTVQEHRAPARALYESLGFRVDLAFRGYRNRSGG